MERVEQAWPRLAAPLRGRRIPLGTGRYAALAFIAAPAATLRAAAARLGRRTWLPGALLALVLTAPAWAPILRPDFNLWALPDGDGHLFRTVLLREVVAAGDWYPRWLPQHYGGYGYPTLNFYAPAVYYLTLAIGALPRVGLYGAFQVLGALAALLAIGGTYTLGWQLWRHGSAAAASAAVAAYAPYLLIANLFVRGALPETLGLALVPLLLVACLGMWTATTSGRPAHRHWWAVVGVTVALLLTHNLAALLAAAVALGWTGFLFLWRPSGRAVARLAGAGALGAALTGFFWLPAVWETPLVQVERMQRGPLSYRNWFLLWPGYHPPFWGLQERSPWTPGVPIDLHVFYHHAIYGSPKLALWQGVALAAALGALATARVGLPRSRARTDSAAPKASEADRRRLIALTVAYGLVLAVVAYALMFDWMLPLWERFAALRTLQFPMRLLGPAGYGVALAAGGALALRTVPSRAVWATTGAAMVVLVALNTRERPLQLSAGVSREAGLARVMDQQRALQGWTYGESGEFLPRTAAYTEWHEGEARGFWLYERMFPEASWTGGRLLGWQGHVAVHHLAGGALWTSAEVSVEPDERGRGGVVAFHQLAFPGWRAWVDGHPTPITPAPWLEAQAIAPGFILVDVPPGTHLVAIRFGPDGPRLAGAGLTLAALGGIAAWALWRAARFPAARRRTAALGVVIMLVGGAAAARLLTGLRSPTTGAHRDQIVAVSIPDEVLAGRAAISSPSGANLGRDQFVDVRSLDVQAQDRPVRDAGPRSRRWLFTHAPAEVTLDVEVPASAYFQASLALDPAMWDAATGDGVRFIAAVQDGAGRQTALVDATVNPRARGEQRRWLDVVANLGPWAGQRVRLVLRTEPRQDPTFDWAGWGDAMIVRLDPLTAARLQHSADELAKQALRG